MNLGVMVFATDNTPGPAEIAQMMEERGFEALFFTEHTHIPVSRETPYPAGGELPEYYWHTYDPFVACTAAACATTTLKVGTGICLVIERDPITTAKEVASVDHVSNGRFLFGVGAGWNREEMRNHGTDPRTRMRLMTENVEAMKAIWTENEPEYHGEFVDFDPIWAWPKPLQSPHPPILVGGNGPTVFDRVLGFGDAWMPNNVGDDVVLEQIGQLRERAGRDVPITFNGGSTKPERLQRYAEAGIERVNFNLLEGDRAAFETRLDEIVAAATEAGLR